jgi:hypothetical protein
LLLLSLLLFVFLLKEIILLHFNIQDWEQYRAIINTHTHTAYKFNILLPRRNTLQPPIILKVMLTSIPRALVKKAKEEKFILKITFFIL